MSTFTGWDLEKKKSTRLRSVASSWKTSSVSAESTLSRARPLAPGSRSVGNARTRDFGSCAQRQDACHGCGAVPSPRHEGVSTLSQTNIIRHRKLTNSEGKNQRFPLLLCFVPGPLLESVGALDSFFWWSGEVVLRLFPAVRVSSCLFVTCSFELSSQRKVSRLGPWHSTPTGVKIIFLFHQKARSSGSCGQLASWVSAAPGKKLGSAAVINVKQSLSRFPSDPDSSIQKDVRSGDLVRRRGVLGVVLRKLSQLNLQ